MPLSVSISTIFACLILSPNAGDTVTQGTPVTITGKISRSAAVVQVKLGSTVLGAASIVGLDWSFSWTPQGGDVGAGVLSAVATSPSAEVAPSPNVAITVAASIDFSTFFTGGTVLQSVQSDKGVTTGATFTWADQSGNNKHYTQATAAKQPTLTTGLNGNPGVLFMQNFITPANSQLVTSTLNLPAPGTTPTWMGIVWRNITPSANGRPWSDTSTGLAQTAYMASNDAKLTVYNGSAGPLDTAPPALNAWECSEFYFSNSTADYCKRGSNAAVTGVNAGNSVGTGRSLGGEDATANYSTIEVLHVIYVNSKQVSAIANWRAAVAAKFGGSVLV